MVGNQLFLVHADGCNHMTLGRLVDENADDWAAEVVETNGCSGSRPFRHVKLFIEQKVSVNAVEVSLRATMTKSQ
jgi:hypothetical protein